MLDLYSISKKIKRKRFVQKNIFKFSLIIVAVFLSSELLNSKIYANSMLKKDIYSSDYSLTVVITNIRNKSGRIQLDLYKNQAEFEARFSDKARRVYLYKKNAVNGKISYTYKNEPAGCYGVAILDDENLNGKMDYGWILPTEGFGFGDYWHTKWRTPTFEDFKFNLEANKTTVVKVKYL